MLNAEKKASLNYSPAYIYNVTVVTINLTFTPNITFILH